MFCDNTFVFFARWQHVACCRCCSIVLMRLVDDLLHSYEGMFSISVTMIIQQFCVKHIV